jgi:PAS domain S-box-containing protein
MNNLLFFFSGFALTVGGLSFYTGLSSRSDRSYLYFGLLSLFAGLYFVIQVASIQIINERISDFLAITLACGFYGLFLWFIGEYTSYNNNRFKVIISFLILITYGTYFLARSSIMSWVLWENMAHITILCIGIFGIFASISKTNNKHASNKYLLILLLCLLLLTTLVYGTAEAFKISIILEPFRQVSPLDYFPIVFSLLVGLKMNHDIIRSQRLEIQMRIKDREWSNLMEKVHLLIVQLSCDGKIEWTNSFLKKITGYIDKDLIGNNWFDLMIESTQIKEVKDLFSHLIDGNEPDYANYNILTKNRETKNIHWTNLILKDIHDNCTGVLCLGADITQLESAYQEIKFLKDKLEKENLFFKEEFRILNSPNEIIGKSDTLKYALYRVEKVAETDTTVLIEGETGTGKELIARAIHSQSKCSDAPMLKMNCSAIPSDLLESELFGHEKGAFTGADKQRIGRFEAANRGTLFLDEIGELPLELQPKLLRVLEDGEFERLGSNKTIKTDVRILAATNRNLKEEVNNGNFRSDLFYRLNTFQILVPPLRKRKEDIPLLIDYFVAMYNKKFGKSCTKVSKNDLQLLNGYDWPGNIRELRNVLERAMIFNNGEVLRIKKNYLDISTETGNNGFTPLETVEKNYIIKVLKACNWRIEGNTGAAGILGLHPNTLRNRMQKLNIKRPN